MKKRYIALLLILAFAVYKLFFGDYRTTWSNTDELAIKGPVGYSYYMLSDFQHWSNWLAWSWHPIPTVETTTDQFGPVANILDAEGDLIAQLRPGSRQPNQSVSFNIAVGSQADSMSGSCNVLLNGNDEQHVLKWQCQGGYADHNAKWLMRIGLYPDPPFDIKQSFGRLKWVIEHREPQDWPK